MSEYALPISNLNDFIFCPVSPLRYLSEAGKPLLGFIHTLLTHSKTVQYSVYEIDNSEKILYNIIAEINNNFAKKFDQTDSVYIFKMSASCEVQKFGYAKNEDSVLLMV